jgi:hypothetical protein
MAIVQPFPSNRRVGAVRRLAAQMLAYCEPSAEKLLQSRLRKHAECLAAKGVDPELVAEDVQRFHAAVRTEIWSIVMRPRNGGGAA